MLFMGISAAHLRLVRGAGVLFPQPKAARKAKYISPFLVSLLLFTVHSRVFLRP